jgi:hypothetical protein
MDITTLPNAVLEILEALKSYKAGRELAVTRSPWAEYLLDGPGFVELQERLRADESLFVWAKEKLR